MNFAVIFDMDGVLIDSVSLAWQAYNQILAAYGVHVAPEQIHKYMGRALRDQMQQLSHDYEISIDYATFEREATEIKQALARHIQPLPGAEACLQMLKANHIPLAVGTSSNRQIMLDRLKTAGLLDYFDKLVTSDDVVAHKPEPDVYLECAKQLGVEAQQCIVIEDAPSGIAAAHNANMKCIAITSQYTSQDSLGAAEYVIDSLTAINIPLLRELLTTKS